MKNEDLVVFAATYSAKDDAKQDMAVLRDLAFVGDLRKLTAVLITRNDKGHVHVHEMTEQGRDGASVGMAAGLVLGAIFPPAGLAVLSGALAGAVSLSVVGGAIGHFAGGVSRHDMKEIGAMLDDGEAAVVAVAVDALATDIDNALTHAAKKARKHVAKGDVGAAVTDLENGLEKALRVADEGL